jgi:hypothetical protein
LKLRALGVGCDVRPQQVIGCGLAAHVLVVQCRTSSKEDCA